MTNFVALSDVKGVISFDDFLRVRRHFMGAGSVSNTSASGPVGGASASGCGLDVGDKGIADMVMMNKMVGSHCDDDLQLCSAATTIQNGSGGNSLSLQHSKDKGSAKSLPKVKAAKHRKNKKNPIQQAFLEESMNA